LSFDLATVGGAIRADSNQTAARSPAEFLRSAFPSRPSLHVGCRISFRLCSVARLGGTEWRLCYGLVPERHHLFYARPWRGHSTHLAGTSHDGSRGGIGLRLSCNRHRVSARYLPVVFATRSDHL